jgi:hypothetical protein
MKVPIPVTTVIGYIKSTKEAGEERKKLLQEASSTLNFLVLQKNKAAGNEWANTLRIVTLPNGPVDGVGAACIKVESSRES